MNKIIEASTAVIALLLVAAAFAPRSAASGGSFQTNGNAVVVKNWPAVQPVSQTGLNWSIDTSYAGAASPVNAHVSKNTSATFGGAWSGNYVGSIRYLMLFNQNTTPTNGTTPVLQYPIGIGVASSPTTWALGSGYYGPGGLTGVFTNGLAWAISTTPGTLTLANATDCDVEVDYK